MLASLTTGLDPSPFPLCAQLCRTVSSKLFYETSPLSMYRARNNLEESCTKTIFNKFCSNRDNVTFIVACQFVSFLSSGFYTSKANNGILIGSIWCPPAICQCGFKTEIDIKYSFLFILLLVTSNNSKSLDSSSTELLNVLLQVQDDSHLVGFFASNEFTM